MQSTGPGPQSFQLVRRAHQAESYEVWDGQSPTGRPVAMVLLPPPMANNPAARAAFGAAVAWAQRPDNPSVAVMAHDVIGPTPWVAIEPDPQGQAVGSFLQQLSSADNVRTEKIPAPTVWPAAAPFAPPAEPSPAGAVPVNVSSGPWPTTSPTTSPTFLPTSPWQSAPSSGPSSGPASGAPMSPTSGGAPSSAPLWPTSGGAPSSAPPWPTSAPPAPVSGAGPQAAPLPWEMPGYPAPVRSPEVPPLPGPGEWPSQQRRSRKPLLLVLIGAIVLILVGGGIAAVLVLPGRADSDGKPKEKQAGPATPSASPSPSPSPSPQPSFRAGAIPVAVIGQTWLPTDKTKVQVFQDWPFAFRIPVDMTCEFWVGEPDYKADNCTRGVQPNHTVMAFVIHRCVNGCDATEQAQFETMTPWKPDVALTAKDATTKFGDVNYGNGRVQLTMLHYFSPTPGGPLSWVVIVQGNSPIAERETVRKVVNDIRSQTG